MGQRFEDKVVWITGGGSGIGRSLALEFAREGASLAVSGRRKEKLDAVVREVEALGCRAIAVTCNVTDEADVERAASEVITAFGRMDVAVANAGFAVAGRIEKLSAEEWRRQLDTNVVGLAVTARHALPHLRKTGGRLALIGSASSMMSTPNVGAYAASKYAVRAIGQALAAELHGSGVSCTTLHPGFVASEIGQVDNHGVHRPEFEDRRPQRLMWSSERAARVMVKAIAKRKREYVFTGHGKVGGFFGRHMPGVVHFLVTRGRADGYRRSRG
jgi:NAD(P)-dependent dehydrogenase (short-subunit alcohol dehydrogenase family)